MSQKIWNKMENGLLEGESLFLIKLLTKAEFISANHQFPKSPVMVYLEGRGILEK